MDLRHLFLQERLRDGTIGAIEKIDTSVNLADVGTKHFTASRLEELKRLLGMVDVVNESVLHGQRQLYRRSVAGVEAQKSLAISGETSRGTDQGL